MIGRCEICAFAVALCGSVAAGARAQDFIDSTALHEAGLVKFWQLQLPLDRGQRLADAYLVDDQVYATTQDGWVFAIHAHTGAVRWLRQVTTGGYRVLRPCHAGDRTIIVTTPEILQVNRLVGEAIRRTPLRFPAGSPPVSDGRLIYLGGLNQRVYAFPLDRDFEIWKAGVGSPVTGAPGLWEGELFIPGNDGMIHACVARNKLQRWISRTTGPITADLVVDRNGVYAACQDQSLYLFDLQFGEIRWRVRLNGPLSEPPAVTAEHAFQYSPADGVVAILATGANVAERVLWKLPRGRRVATVDSRHVHVLTIDERIQVARIGDGQVVHEFAAPGFTMAMPSPAETAIYLASPDGRVFCARPLGVPLVTAEDVRKALLPPAPPPAPTPQRPAAAPATQPAEAALRGPTAGPPVGGKSRVSRRYGESAGPSSSGGTPGGGP